jgi:hypothetical protein
MSDVDLYEERQSESEYEQLSDEVGYENESAEAYTDFEGNGRPQHPKIEYAHPNLSKHPHYPRQSQYLAPSSTFIRMGPNDAAISSKEMSALVRYYFNRYNIIGWTLNCLAFLFYANRFIIQRSRIDSRSGFADGVEMRVLFRLRYIGAMAYFLLAALYPSYIYEWHNSEAPLLFTTVMQVKDAYFKGFEPDHHLFVSDWFDLWGGVLVCLLCFLRRKPVLRIFLNPYSKDRSQLAEIIKRDRQLTTFL